MKNSYICTKCQSTNVVKVETFKNTSTDNVIMLSKWGTLSGYFDRYVCLSCGFMELYAKLEDKAWQKWIDEKEKENSLDSDFV